MEERTDGGPPRTSPAGQPPTDSVSQETPTGRAYEPPRISAPLVAALHERYEVIRETGHGASAIVYLARDRKHDRLVALKTLNPDVGTVAADRFLREIQVSAGMQHPHILPTYDSGIADGRLYFVMPFVDGGSLRQRLEAEPRMPIADALQCAHDISLALAFAHDQGVVHRDAKPENIMYYHGHACLADFGVARIMQEMDVRVTGHGMVVGTPAYMSPEQLTDGGFDGRSDVYSLACVLYEMIAGVHAFAGSTPHELLRQRLRNPPPPLHTHRPDAPQFVEDLLTRALAASPADRFEDARAFADAIEFALRHITAPTRRNSAPRRAIASVPRHPFAWVASSVLAIAAVAFAATPLRTLSRDRNGMSLAPPQQLALARTLELQRQVSTDRFRVAAARLGAMRSSFHGRDSLIAEGMIALAGRAYPQACAAFDRVRAADSLDAFAWIGLGDCAAMDSAVVRDDRGNWKFRTGWHSAARAYMRAVAIDPSMYRTVSYGTLTVLRPASPSQIRVGRTQGDHPETFLAHPSLAGDTVGYVPVAARMFAEPTEDVDPLSEPAALRRNRDELVAFARQWSSAEPENPEALEALALGLETRGELSDDDGAAAALRKARARAKTPEQRLRLASMSVRLRVKRAQFDPARALADSLLAAYASTNPSPAEASRLAGLAALTGRVHDAARYRARATSAENADAGIAPQVTAVESRLFVRAALGVCDDSLTRLARSVDDLLDSYTQRTGRQDVRAALLGRPLSLAFPCLGARAVDGIPARMPLDRAQRAMAAGRPAVVRATLDSVTLSRRGVRPGDVSLDFSVQEAWLRAASRDTAGAVRQLDLVLNALPTLGPFAVREEAQSAAVGRALMLRAELAAAQHDDGERRRRAADALALWQHADAPMYPTLERLRNLARR